MNTHPTESRLLRAAKRFLLAIDAYYRGEPSPETVGDKCAEVVLADEELRSALTASESPIKEIDKFAAPAPLDCPTCGMPNAFEVGEIPPHAALQKVREALEIGKFFADYVGEKDSCECESPCNCLSQYYAKVKKIEAALALLSQSAGTHGVTDREAMHTSGCIGNLNAGECDCDAGRGTK